MAAGPVVLRHPDAGRQATMFGAFSGALMVGAAIAVMAASGGARWWFLAVLGPFALLTAYLAFRLVTARVILDERGLCEPAPFRPTIITPWDDVIRVRKTQDARSKHLTFLGVSIEHKGGWKHQPVALTISTRDPRASEIVEEWLEAIRDGKRLRSE